MASGGQKWNDFTPECELLYEGGPSSQQLHHDCPKNPGHHNFLSVKDFKIDHLPPEMQTEKMMEYIQFQCARTVKVDVGHTSVNRPDTYPDTTTPYPFCELKGCNRVKRCGTGLIESFYSKACNRPCPCHICRDSEQPKMKYWELVVVTATHVIYDSFEAYRSVFECFYDSEDRSGVRNLYGTRILRDDVDPEIRCTSDWSSVVCVTHEEDLVHALVDLPENQLLHHRSYCKRQFRHGVLVSHPHGLSKKISMGKIWHSIYLNKFWDSRGRGYFRDRVRCRIPDASTFPWKTFKKQLAISNDKDAPTKDETNNNKLMTTQDKLSPSQTESVNMCLHWFNPPLILKPGMQFDLPSGMSFIQPEYFKQNYFDDKYVTFPTGTIFTSKDGSEVFLPPEVEFDIKDDVGAYRLSDDHYVTYDIDSCPGSSGGTINYIDGYFYGAKETYIFHSGAIKGGHNRSVFFMKDKKVISRKQKS